MKASIALIIPGIVAMMCYPAEAIARKNLSLKDAEKILGEPGHLMDSATKRVADAVDYSISYKANKQDAKRLKTGTLYFFAEDYDQLASAKKRYNFIMTANQNHGIRLLHDVGDEAYFHTDNANFYFIMVRKGKHVFNMKVNKVTSNTSLQEFNRIAREIAAAI
jgi:hypothetical protein